MKRTAIIALVVAAGLFGVIAWQGLSQEREYRRLIAEGDRALASDQTFVALENFSGAITLRRDAMLAYLKRGETYKRRGEMTEALRDLRNASRLDPTATRPLELLGDVNAAIERYARAEESYDAYLKLDDRSPRVLYKLALTRHRQGRTTAALPPLRQALIVDDRFAPAHYLLGVCLQAISQPVEATSSLERAVTLDPGLSAAREQLVDIYTAAHRDKEAVVQLEALAALDPRRPDRLVALAKEYARTGRADLAVMTFRRVIDDYPDHQGVYVALGRFWLETAENNGDRVGLTKALAALGRVAHSSPPDSEALLLLGRAQLLDGDVSAAERSLKLATSQYPVEAEALYQLSVVAERAGHLASARDALARYVALSGDGVPSFDRAMHLGDLSVRLNELAAASTWYTKAVENSAATTAAFARLAEVQMRVGDKAGAAGTVARGLRHDPHSATLTNLQRRVDAMPAAAKPQQ